MMFWMDPRHVSFDWLEFGWASFPLVCMIFLKPCVIPSKIKFCVCIKQIITVGDLGNGLSSKHVK